MCIETYGKGERLRIAAAILSRCSKKHLVLLPLPTTKDNKNVTNTDIPLCEALLGVGRGSLVVGYALPADFVARAEALGGEVLDLLSDEEFLGVNARLTALGTLGVLLTTERRALYDSTVGVIGYGRIGEALTKMLTALGVKVRVYSTRAALRSELSALSIESRDTKELLRGEAALSDVDILINTAELDLSGAFVGGALPLGVRVIELASGENFKGVSGVERLPAIPERMYPESAAAAYADAVNRYIRYTESAV